MEILNIILLGIIEGITEFLPISSTGHLLIAEHWLGARSDLFIIAIQAGAILAVVVIYWRRLCGLLLNFSKPENHDYALKLGLAFLITVVGGVVAKHFGFELPNTVQPVAWALIIGGIAILAIEKIVGDQPEKTHLSWKAAFWVGIGQIVAMIFPGMSRSASTIFAAMLAGVGSRPAATEFAFLLGIPTMFAATAYEAAKVVQDGDIANEDWSGLAIGFVVSAIVAFISVKWLLRYIQTHRFTVFAWYRMVLGVALLLLVDGST